MKLTRTSSLLLFVLTMISARLLAEPFTFSDLSELSAAPDASYAIQLGGSGGIWIKKQGAAESNGGTIVEGKGKYHWARQCDPGRLDARWFGVKADGKHDDANALQAALDALPESGGKLLLPSGRMLCRQSLHIRRSFITIEGTNCGLLSKMFEAGPQIGIGSLLFFEGCDGIIVSPPAQEEGKPLPARLGGITFREFGIAGTGREDGQRGIVVQRDEKRSWGSVDGLLIDRIYCIELEWAVDLLQADMSVIRDSWFSECGNGLRMRGCIYSCISNICFADNNGYGLLMTQGKGNEITSSVFVRNKVSLHLENTQRTRINGGIFEHDGAGGKRVSEALILSKDNGDLSITGTSFFNQYPMPDSAVRYSGTPPKITGVSLAGKVTQESKQLPVDH